jgi:hypothetical protein
MEGADRQGFAPSFAIHYYDPSVYPNPFLNRAANAHVPDRTIWRHAAPETARDALAVETPGEW